MNKKFMLAAAVLALMMTAAAGCGSKQPAENSSTASLPTSQSDGTNAEDASLPGQEGGTDGTLSEGIGNNETGNAAPGNREAGDDAPESNGTGSRELVFIGGKVRSVSQDSFVISLTLSEESADGYGSVVVMPEAGSPEEELVTVRCMDSTVFKRWTIKGSGEDIKEEEAVFSEIQEGTGLEAQGYFDGKEFLAEKVIIEIYE